MAFELEAAAERTNYMVSYEDKKKIKELLNKMIVLISINMEHAKNGIFKSYKAPRNNKDITTLTEGKVSSVVIINKMHDVNEVQGLIDKGIL